jgi:hypothetical protein
MALENLWNPSDRLARMLWACLLRLLRKGVAKNFNHKVARHLSPNHAAHFLERGKAQNAFARRYGLAVTKLFVNVVLLALLVAAVTFVAQSLYVHGYLTAPGSPPRGG